jgi:hypothetical protein
LTFLIHRFAKKKIAFTFAALYQSGGANKDDSVAQLVEHIPFKDGVLGPNPSWVTFRNFNNPVNQLFTGLFHFIHTTFHTTFIYLLLYRAKN